MTPFLSRLETGWSAGETILQRGSGRSEESQDSQQREMVLFVLLPELLEHFCAVAIVSDFLFFFQFSVLKKIHNTFFPLFLSLKAIEF